MVRVGIDSTCSPTADYGGWNAPVDLDTGEFVYVPLLQSWPEQGWKCAGGTRKPSPLWTGSLVPGGVPRARMYRLDWSTRRCTWTPTLST
jgi:hypothetical protein